MHRILQRLHRDHRNLAKLLDVLERQLDDFHEGREHDFDLMCELVEYIECYEDQVHHPTEDLIFGRLKVRTQDRRVAVDTLEEQHRLLAEMTGRFRKSLEGVMHEEVLLRHDVEAQGRAMVKMLRQHMELEDTQVFPLADSALTDDDWEGVAEQAPKYNDPVFGDRDPARFRTLYQHLATELGFAPAAR